MRHRSEAARVATLLVVLASLLLAGPGAPPAAADTCEGVWVVVDARAAGGTITTRCAPGDPATGLAALESALHDYAFVPHIPGMVCTIDARPDPCNGAPTNAYWSYWYAEAGGAWTYASVGAGSRNPAPGTVEGWRFGDGSAPPGVAPPAAPAPAPEPDPEPPASSTPAPSGTTEPAPVAPERGATADTGTTSQGGDTSSREPAPPSAPADTTETTSPPTQEPPTETGAAPVRQRLDPRTSPSLPRPSPGSATVGEAAGPGAEPGNEPGDAPDPDPAATTSEAGETLAAAASDERAGRAPIGPALAVGLLAVIGALTWHQRRQRDRARS